MTVHKTIVVQSGHCFRTRGATGTSGHRGSEQDFVARLGFLVTQRLQQAGHTVHWVKADQRVPKCNGFISLHQDGSTNKAARGGSIGYWPGNAKRNALWAKNYKGLATFFGWPSGWRRDNYTSGLSGYYAWRRAVSLSFGAVRKADFQVLIENGFATNYHDENYVWDNMDTIAWNIANAVQVFYSLPAIPVDTTAAMPQLEVEPVVVQGPFRVPIPIFRPSLTRGSRHEGHVKAVQSLLGVTADGSFGPLTEDRVRVFQTWNGLPVDGVVSGDDWKVLDRINNERPKRAA